MGSPIRIEFWETEILNHPPGTIRPHGSVAVNAILRTTELKVIRRRFILRAALRDVVSGNDSGFRPMSPSGAQALLEKMGH